MSQPTPATKEKDTTQAFNTIALSLSGGGYRAAAFHLGTMAYLQRVGLLKKVTILSTVSGGSFTGALYALYQAQNKSFEAYYNHLYQCMDTIDLVEEGLKMLSSNGQHDGKGSHNLINAMAHVYHHRFFDKALFSEILNTNTHLKEIIFNATEFHHGLTFRFLASQSNGAKIGNAKVNISREAAQEIRVADMVAASSCFPGGFEPLKFPQDFIHGNEPNLNKLTKTPMFENGVGLMDGGIVDNQGIGSILNALKRKENSNPDLFIISDVSSSYMDPLAFPEKFYSENKGVGIGLIKAAIIGAMVLVGASALSYVLLLLKRIETADWAGVAIEGVGLIIMAVLFYALNLARTMLGNKILGHIPRIGNRAWAYLKKISVSRLTEMMTVRASSMVTMVSDVNMKQVRRLIYDLIYTNSDFKFSRVSNLIDSLTKDSVIKRFGNETYKNLRKPSDKLLQTAESACKMGTTLWFEDNRGENGKYKLRDLIASGEFTICFRLLENILTRYGTEPNTYPPAIQTLYKQLLKDWEAFNLNPRFLLEEMDA